MRGYFPLGMLAAALIASAPAGAEILILKSGERLAGDVIVCHRRGVIFREKPGATGRYYPYDEISRIATRDGLLYYLMPRSSGRKERTSSGFFPTARRLDEQRAAAPVPYVTPPTGEAVRVLCTGVADPVTIILEGGARVRLLGLAPPPETSAARGEAKDTLESLVGGKTVLLFAGPQDPRGAPTPEAYVVCGSTFVNADMIERGLALPAARPVEHPYARAFASLARFAMTFRHGLWEQAIPPQPWCGGREEPIKR